VQTPALFDTDAPPPAPAPFSAASAVIAQANRASWQQSCHACFEQEDPTEPGTDSGLLQFADNGGDEGPDGVIAAAAVFALAAYGSDRNEEPARRRHRQAVIC